MFKLNETGLSMVLGKAVRPMEEAVDALKEARNSLWESYARPEESPLNVRIDSCLNEARSILERIESIRLEQQSIFNLRESFNQTFSEINERLECPNAFWPCGPAVGRWRFNLENQDEFEAVKRLKNRTLTEMAEKCLEMSKGNQLPKTDQLKNKLGVGLEVWKNKGSIRMNLYACAAGGVEESRDFIWSVKEGSLLSRETANEFCWDAISELLPGMAQEPAYGVGMHM